MTTALVKVDPGYFPAGRVGETVYDDLTHEIHRIVSVALAEEHNCLADAYYIDSDYLGGGRFPWELSPVWWP